MGIPHIQQQVTGTMSHDGDMSRSFRCSLRTVLVHRHVDQPTSRYIVVVVLVQRHLDQLLFPPVL